MPELVFAICLLLAAVCISLHAFTAADRKFTRDIAAMDKRLGLPPCFSLEERLKHKGIMP
ncbi:hypothetical protein [Megalodesulfovibrio gigas]|uniref:Uncharacterized protein n=1 Tax=Megalodesulfovibrio gigas (strain ATCC 19364 / DSM 1382 / NCIMB 9332 / VKM B-1759) TaxID=1121448 RepID=T2GC76_MEGG1|nr:hypothetical protein [Megalodesulfovibrio gigas]AGW13779.1 hypothetical protein DGI_2005 [Megalodesulfovibrio gigas DSM 1382 = ATCC 19364]